MIARAGTIADEDLLAVIKRRETAVKKLGRLTAHISRERLLAIFTATMSIEQIETLVRYQRQS